MIRLLEVMFFIGLAGCSVVVLVSWVSILKSSFSNEEESTSEREIAPKQLPSAGPLRPVSGSSV